MTLDEFRASLSRQTPPDGCSRALVALWHDARGDWEGAHRVAQDIDNEDGAWVHAYLHRKEGDSGNARHWYRRACRKFADDSLIDEWERIVSELLVPASDGARFVADDTA
jgi:hypothetical protein